MYFLDNPILCDSELPEIMSAMEINHTRIHGKTECTQIQEPELIPPEETLFNVPHLPPAGFLDLMTPIPQLPPVSTQLEISANQIPAASVTREPPVEIKVVPLPPAALHDAPINEKPSNLLLELEKPLDIEKTP